MFQIVHFQKILEGQSLLNKNMLTAPLYILLVFTCTNVAFSVVWFSLIVATKNQKWFLEETSTLNMISKCTFFWTFKYQMNMRGLSW